MNVPRKYHVLGSALVAALVVCTGWTDGVGDFRWAASAGGAGMDRGRAVVALPDGGCIAAGHFQDTIVFGQGTAHESHWTSVGGVDAWMARFDADGLVQWSRGFGSASNDVCSALSPSIGGYILACGAYRGRTAFATGESGETVLDCSGAQDGFVARYAGDGGLISVLRIGEAGEDAVGGVAPLPDEGYYATGFFQGSMTLGRGEAGETQFSSIGGSDIFLARFRHDNRLAWARRVGSTGNDEGQSLAITSDGGVVVTGVIRGTAIFGAGEMHYIPLYNFGAYTAFVARYNSDGALVWAKAPTSDHGWIGGGNATTLPDDSVLLTGEFSGLAVFGQGEPRQTSLTCSDANGFLARYQADGSLDWAVGLGVEGETVHARAVSALPDGRAVVAGMHFGGATLGLGQARQTHLSAGSVPSYDILLAGYNGDGQLEWAQSAGGPGVDYAFGVGLASGGGVISTGQLTDTITLGGRTLTSVGAEDVLLSRFDPSVTPIPVNTFPPTPTPTPLGGGWSASAGGAGGGGTTGMQLGVAADGGVIVAGEFNANAVFGRGEPNETQFACTPGDNRAFLARYQPGGMLAWAKSIGGNYAGQRPEGIAVAPDGTALVCGSFEGPTLFGAGEVGETTLVSAGDKDVFLACYHPYGHLLWARSAGGTGMDQGFSVAFASDGGAAVAGSFVPTAVFGAKLGATDAVAGGPPGMFLARYRPSGSLAWVVASSSGAEGLAVATAPNGKILVQGAFQGAVTWGSGAGQSLALPDTGVSGAFLACYNDDGTLAWLREVARGPNYHVARRVMVRPDGRIGLAGQYAQSITFAPGQPQEQTLSSDGSEIWIAWLDSAGQLESVRRVVGANTSHLIQADLAADGSVKIAGFFTQSFYDATLPSAGKYDVFAASVSPSGWMQWAGRVGGAGDDLLFDIGAYGLDRIVVTGRFEGDAVYEGWGRGSKTLHAQGVWDMFVAALGRPPSPIQYGWIPAVPPYESPTPTPRFPPAATPTPTPAVGPEQMFVFVLDDYGAVHTGGAANQLILTGGPYFGWDIARDLALVHGLPAKNDAHLGVLVLDGFGAVHSLSANRPPQNFYFDPEPGAVAAAMGVFQGDLAGVPGNIGLFVLDRHGKLWAAGEADPAVAFAATIDPPLNGVTQYAVDLLLGDPAGNSGWILDNMGHVHAFGGAAASAFAVSAQDNWKALARVAGQLVRMDAAGNLEWSGLAKPDWQIPMVDGELMVDLEVEEGLGLVALDRYGALYTAGEPVLPAAGQGPPYLGTQAARDLELGPPFMP